MYQKYFKRMIDLMITVPAVIILFPAMLFIGILVKIKLGSPVIFTQKRVGYREKIFTIYKFRSMTEERDGQGNLLPNEQRLTPFGRALRSLSLDELPQLFNILKGDLSMIGPRALPSEYLSKYTDEQRKRHNVMPGLVGLAALHGRNAQSWDSKFHYDLEYVERISLGLDIKIFWGAIFVVLHREGIDGTGVSPF